ARAAWITPVPGGVGPMTIAMLLSNTVDAALARKGVQARLHRSARCGCKIARMKSPVQELLIDALRDAGNARRSDAIAVEEPLEIRLMRDGLPEADENGGTGRSLSVTMRTPGHDAELAAGFLHGEGLLRERRDVIEAGHCGPTGNILRVTVRHDLPLDLASLARNFYATSSCGVCGKAS